MKKILGNFLMLLFCAFILLLSVKGISGNPKGADLINPVWNETGPLEPSIEGGRFALLYSIVEDRSLEFTKDVALLATPDLGYRNGKYVSLFAPGISIVAIPGYVLGKMIGLSQVGSFATIALFALFNVYLIRKIALLMGANNIASVIASFTFLFATPAFAYATTFYQHHVSTSLILLSIFILLRFNTLISLVAIWVIYAFAFIVDYPNLIMMAPIAIFAISKMLLVKRTSTKISVNFSIPRILTILSVIIPLLFLFWYNQNANGGPFQLSGTLDRVMSIDTEGVPLLGSDLVKEAIENKTMTIPPNSSFFSAFLNRSSINGLYTHFLSIDRGMLFYAPIMFFGIFSLFQSIKKWNRNIILLVSVIAFNIIVYSMWDDPQGGWAFGSRYLIPTYSVLAVFIAILLTKFKKYTAFLLLYFVVLAYSVGVNTLGAVSSTSNPPKHEAIALAKKYKTEQKYTFLRNVDQLNKGNSKSFVYRTYAAGRISAWNYYSNIAVLLIITFGFLMTYYALSQSKSVRESVVNSYNRLVFKSNVSFSYKWINKPIAYFEKNPIPILITVLSIISILNFIFYYLNGMGLAYNDARSHLDIGRRVVENLKPGFAQLGSVWLPLTHLFMTLTVWNDFMWHSGLSGALQSMVAYVATGVLIYLFLRRLGVNLFGRIIGVLIFSLNLNIMYMQSTSMTELPLIALMMAGVYELMIWHQSEKIFNLIKAGFWIMLSTLIRYDGWFLFVFATGLIFLRTLKRRGYKTAEGVSLIFMAMGGFGILLWIFWNWMIFKDPLFFAFGDFSANAQQKIIEQSGSLTTKGNIAYSIQSYLYAVVFNSDFITFAFSIVGGAMLWLDKRIEKPIRYASLALLSPLLFNVIALVLGHSVLFVQGLGGNSWFNVRYGLTLVPTIAIFVGYLVFRARTYRFLILGLILFVSMFGYINQEVVTLDDARIGLGGKNVTEVSSYLRDYAANKDGFVLLSVAKHDAIIFSSGLPMTRFIHEGTGDYWDLATVHPDRWARWIVLRTNDENDLTTKLVKHKKSFKDKYVRVRDFPFAEVYELKEEYVKNLQSTPPIAIKK
ncbi:MAG TPA: hypothetical protein VM077_05895 [Candidatus Limnocylindrales bacterium]|nr:hypothetical protein [Candidatus Limnocylindrales bacterium]